jgi:hypothetical protein
MQFGPAFEVELAQADGLVTTVLVDPIDAAVTAAPGRDGDRTRRRQLIRGPWESGSGPAAALGPPAALDEQQWSSRADVRRISAGVQR